VFCIANFRVLLHTSGLWNTATFRFFPVGMELFLPPLVYLYVLSLTEENFNLDKKYFWHFLPGLFYASYDILIYLMTLRHDALSEKDQLANQLYFNQLNLFEDYLIVILTLTYVVLGARKITAYLSWLTQFKQYKSFAIFGWLRSMIFWSSVLGGVLMINQLMDTFSIAMNTSMYRWRFLNLLLAFITYYFAFMGYKKDGLNVHVAQANLTSLANKLSTRQAQELEERLIEKLDKENVYLDGSITLKQLAADLEVTTENLSFVVNQKFDMGFRELINSYRVSRFKKLLMENNSAELSILDLALDSGFNSQASFYRAFKKLEGMTPKAYLAQLSKIHSQDMF
jgi:AraC-like DNA-binding protein